MNQKIEDKKLRIKEELRQRRESKLNPLSSFKLALKEEIATLDQELKRSKSLSSQSFAQFNINE